MASFLTIDAGNTHLKWALFEDHKLVRTEQDDQLCEGCPLKLLLQTLLPQAAIVADVANRLPELQRLLSDRLPLLVLDHHTALPFVNAYQTPSYAG